MIVWPRCCFKVLYYKLTSQNQFLQYETKLTGDLKVLQEQAASCILNRDSLSVSWQSGYTDLRVHNNNYKYGLAACQSEEVN
jgi:hypothetical protein